MNSSNQGGRWRMVLQWVAGISSLVYVLSRFVPPAALPPGARLTLLDDSWRLVLNWAFKQHQQFGQGIVFTLGPLGFLGDGRDPAVYPVYFFIWVLISLIFWLAAWCLARHFSANEGVGWLWVVLFTGIAGMDLDDRLIAPVILLLALHFFVKGRLSLGAECLLAAALGCLSLVKFTVFTMTTGSVLIIAADDVIRRRRIPWVASCFFASVWLCWLADGQRAQFFWPFLEQSWQVAAGFTEAMMIDTGGDLRSVIAFWLAAAVAALPLVWLAARQKRTLAAWPALALAFVTFLVFKHGYVRHDGHEVAAVLFVLLMGMAGLAVAWPEWRNKSSRDKRLGILVMAMIGVYGVTSYYRCADKGNLLMDLAKTWSPQALGALKDGLVGRKAMDDRYNQYLAEVRNQFPVPPLTGTVDSYSWNQAAILAAGLQYCPRPTFQSYAAYTPALERGNAVFLEGKQAPDNILFTVQTIDRRFPSLDDGLSWPELLTRYDVTQTTPEWVLLQHSPQPRTHQLIPIMSKNLGFGETFSEMPSNGLVWAELEIDRTLSGKLTSMFYKPSTLWMIAHLRDGTERPCRIVPEMARCGFLLSPLIEDSPEFASLTSAGRDALAGKEIVSLSILAATETGATSDYKVPFKLRLYRLDLGSTANSR